MAEQETQTGQPGEERRLAQPGNPMEGGMFNLNPGPMDAPKDKRGFRVDFNLGVRLELPPGPARRVRLSDLDTAFVVYDGPVDGGQILSSDKKFFIRWKVEVWEGEKQVFSHSYDAKGKDVLIEVCSVAMGDTLAFLPYARLFKERHGCRKVYLMAADHMLDLLRANCPDIVVLPRGKRPPGLYASYYMGNFYPSTNRNLQPYNWQMTGLQRCGASILGLPMEEEQLVLKPTGGRPVEEPYVCIATQATAQCKFWNNPRGWLDTVAYLKSIGYRVLCIDKEKGFGTGGYVNTIPWGAEDFTGARPLTERVDVLAHADFFIGLGSGLSWLAWGTGIPVILISGFSSPWSEFSTPYRLINLNICNSCFDDGQKDFDMGAFDWCPRHHDDIDRRYECTRGITSEYVIQTIRRLMADHGLDPKRGSREELGK